MKTIILILSIILVLLFSFGFYEAFYIEDTYRIYLLTINIICIVVSLLLIILIALTYRENKNIPEIIINNDTLNGKKYEQNEQKVFAPQNMNMFSGYKNIPEIITDDDDLDTMAKKYERNIRAPQRENIPDNIVIPPENLASRANEKRKAPNTPINYGQETFTEPKENIIRPPHPAATSTSSKNIITTNPAATSTSSKNIITTNPTATSNKNIITSNPAATSTSSQNINNVLKETQQKIQEYQNEIEANIQKFRDQNLNDNQKKFLAKQNILYRNQIKKLKNISNLVSELQNANDKISENLSKPFVRNNN